MLIIFIQDHLQFKVIYALIIFIQDHLKFKVIHAEKYLFKII